MPDEPMIADVLKDAPKNWGRWGPEDEIGSVNYLDAPTIARAAAAVRSGKTFSLSLMIGDPRGDPTAGIRTPARHFMTADQARFDNGHLPPLPGGGYYSDDAVFMYLQGSTQIDALGHVWYDRQLYNGYDSSTTNGGLKRCSVLPLAEHGLVGRGVLLDVARFLGVRRLEANQQIPLEMMLACAKAQNVELRKRDMILFHTGWLSIFWEGGMEAVMGGGEPGITDEPELIRWFQEMEIAAQGSDTIAAEQSTSSVSGLRIPLHYALIRNLGIPFLEMLDLAALAEDCAADGQYDFMLVISPLKVRGACGSPINPLAIK